jgi:hypothetical protein
VARAEEWVAGGASVASGVEDAGVMAGAGTVTPAGARSMARPARSRTVRASGETGPRENSPLEGKLPLDGAELFIGGEKNAQAGGADIGDGGKIEAEAVVAGADRGGDRVLHGLAPVGVEAAGEAEDGGLVGGAGGGDFHVRQNDRATEGRETEGRTERAIPGAGYSTTLPSLRRAGGNS